MITNYYHIMDGFVYSVFSQENDYIQILDNTQMVIDYINSYDNKEELFDMEIIDILKNVNIV